MFQLRLVIGKHFIDIIIRRVLVTRNVCVRTHGTLALSSELGARKNNDSLKIQI